MASAIHMYIEYTHTTHRSCLSRVVWTKAVLINHNSHKGRIHRQKKKKRPSLVHPRSSPISVHIQALVSAHMPSQQHEPRTTQHTDDAAQQRGPPPGRKRCEACSGCVPGSGGRGRAVYGEPGAVVEDGAGGADAGLLGGGVRGGEEVGEHLGFAVDDGGVGVGGGAAGDGGGGGLADGALLGWRGCVDDDGGGGCARAGRGGLGVRGGCERGRGSGGLRGWNWGRRCGSGC